MSGVLKSHPEPEHSGHLRIASIDMSKVEITADFKASRRK